MAQEVYKASPITGHTASYVHGLRFVLPFMVCLISYDSPVSVKQPQRMRENRWTRPTKHSWCIQNRTKTYHIRFLTWTLSTVSAYIVILRIIFVVRVLLCFCRLVWDTNTHIHQCYLTYWAYHTICLLPVRQHRRMWVNTSHQITTSYDTQNKRNTWWEVDSGSCQEVILLHQRNIYGNTMYWNTGRQQGPS